MIKTIHLHNFKCFGDQSIHCAPLTILTGANATGKSSVIQALLLLRQSHQRDTLRDGVLLLNGSLATLGTVTDVFYQNAQDTDLSIEIEASEDIRFKFMFERGEPTQRVLRGQSLQHYEAINLFYPQFNYLSAERLGPRTIFQMPEDEHESHNVGIHGEYAAFVAGRNQQELIANEKLAYTNEETGETRRELYQQVRYWMRQIFPGFEYAITVLTDTDLVQTMFGNLPGQRLVRPTNIGFGLIYTLPVVVAALVAPERSLLIIENPEAHLHPFSQSMLGRFLACVAATGVQVIIETHSDHILNGIRVAVHKGAWGRRIEAKHVSIQFFIPGDETQPHRVETPTIYPSGGIAPWPIGFFDQFDADLTELL